MSPRKKLIEVALPLDAINAASAREKSLRHGHPSTLHLWWARRPLAACRAVLFAQLVDDPSSVPEVFPDEAAQETERCRLFRIIKELVLWENSNDERVIGAARREIARSVARSRGEALPREKAEVDAFLAEKAPPVVDPFCGGGSIPLGGTAAGAAYPQLGPEPGRGAHHQSAGGGPAPVRRPPAGQPPRRGRSSPSARPLERQGVRKDWPRMCATTAAGCARRLRGVSATCIRRSR